MITRKKFDPKKISVTEINEGLYEGFMINYEDVFNIYYGESSDFYDITWFNPNYKTELVERLAQQTLEYMLNNPTPNKGE